MISFVAPSGTGKTTLVEQVIAELVRRGIDVAGVKHDAHRIELDTEGKDSWRMRKAGADTLLVGATQLAWMSDRTSAPSLDALVELFFADADVIIVEGYRSAGLPTVLVQRPEVDDPTWERPAAERIIATVHPSEIERAVDAVIDVAGLVSEVPALEPNDTELENTALENTALENTALKNTVGGDSVLAALAGVEHEIVDCDPALADTEAFCRAYGYQPEDSANAILVVGKTEERPLACCLVLATDRLDVNGVVRKRLGVRKASFADAEETVQRTGGMEIGGVTPFGLPPDLPVWVDAAVMDRERIIVGGGGRDRKILCPPSSLLAIDGAEVVNGLAKARPIS